MKAHKFNLFSNQEFGFIVIEKSGLTVVEIQSWKDKKKK